MKRYVYEAVLTPAEEGGFDVSVPDLPGCFTYGDDYGEAVEMAADAMKTYVAALLADGEVPPPVEHHDCPEGCELVAVSFETDETYIVDGEVVSAAEAARQLGLSAGRVTRRDARRRAVCQPSRTPKREWGEITASKATTAQAP